MWGPKSKPNKLVVPQTSPSPLAKSYLPFDMGLKFDSLAKYHVGKQFAS